MTAKRVGYLGPEGTFSEIAAFALQPEATLLPQKNFSQIFQQLESGGLDAGVIPVENKLQGMVRENLDLLYRSDLSVQAELVLPIEHGLAVQPSVRDLTSIRTIASHPQALAQCSKFLTERLSQARWKEVESTAAGLTLALGDSTIAGVGPVLTAERLGLRVEPSISNQHDNVTRFWLIGHEFLQELEHDRVSLAFYFERDVLGCLYHSLGFFAEAQINLTCITSRPSSRSLGNYVFHVDLEANMRESAFEKALRQLEQYADEVRVLGAYLRR